MLLDEIGDAPPEVQTSLLRVLEDMRIRPVGARTSIPVRARLLAATHRDLNQLVKDHSFRFDLRMRLMGASLVLPALRERREDIPLLAQHFATELDPRATLSATTLHEMTLADWPGNVRQLQKFVERLYVEAAGDERLSLSPHLAAELRSPIPLATPVSSPDRTPRQGVAAPLSAAELEDAMRRAGGVISRAAALLSVDVKTFKRRCKDHGLSAAELKERLRRT